MDIKSLEVFYAKNEVSIKTNYVLTKEIHFYEAWLFECEKR